MYNKCRNVIIFSYNLNKGKKKNKIQYILEILT